MSRLQRGFGATLLRDVRRFKNQRLGLPGLQKNVLKILEQIRNFAKGAEIIRDWLGHDGEVVPQTEAQRRADICLQCPNNVHGMALTDNVATAIKEQVEIKNHVQLRVRGEKRLGHCAVCSCVNRLQIWCPATYLNKYSTPEDLEKFPAHCWKRATTV